MTDTRAPLFTFVAVGDTHVNPRDDFSPSPWRTNVLANDRAAAVVAQINALAPDFVVHLGDMIHPLPGSADYEAAAARFHALFGALRMPVHLVPGNHDLGDKPTGWTPAAPVDDAALAAYRGQFGADHHAFEHAGCRFLIVNDEIFNTGLEAEERQWRWLEEELSRGGRTFVFTHYPPFLQAADEVEHYDNLAEPGRGRFLAMIRDRAEAVFCGHVHNFFYNRAGTTDLYVAPATSAIRHDYADMFAVAPGPGTEHGRDQRSKLGFLLVEVYPEGHVVHVVRSFGETDAEAAARGTRRPLASPMIRPAPLGVDLRVGWADVHSVAFAGAVDEFNRKPVRNDCLVQALWELGVRELRVPVRDLVDPLYARRMRDLGARGHRFTAFCYGLPDATAQAAIAEVSAAIAALEITGRMADLPDLAQEAAASEAFRQVPVTLSKLRLSADAEHDGNRFAHFIRHGFRADEPDLTAALELVRANGLAGLVLSVPGVEPAGSAIAAIAQLAADNAMRAQVHVQLAGEDPAVEMADEAALAERVRKAGEAARRAGDRVRVFLDTFCDHDRGYFPRLGLVDRRYDLRAPGEALKRLVETQAAG
ncbi:metallophosphoesterase family protein [Amorphus coralli]|uniref:metallophosphoesterase family protein n=1 Tax=Amorphus coralli TaxID=340680 RepID=UPI00036A4A05|nr:metallophosphoesterase [Amorphus coralli]